MNKDDYLNACEEMLRDSKYYQKETEDRNEEFVDEIRKKVDDMEKRKYINNMEKNFLT